MVWCRRQKIYRQNLSVNVQSVVACTHLSQRTHTVSDSAARTTGADTFAERVRKARVYAGLSQLRCANTSGAPRRRSGTGRTEIVTQPDVAPCPSVRTAHRGLGRLAPRRSTGTAGRALVREGELTLLPTEPTCQLVSSPQCAFREPCRRQLRPSGSRLDHAFNRTGGRPCHS
jgi:hypothetical protein